MKRSIKIFALATALAPWAMAQTQSTSSATATNETQVKVLDGPTAQSVTDTSAVITWTTDKPSSAIVHYGVEEHAMNQTAQQSWGGTKTVTGESHRVEIRGLKPDTEYYFDIESGQAKGISGGGDVYTASHTFKTLAAQAGSGTSGAPTAVAQVKVLDGPSARSITDTSAVIAWTTDKPSSAMVHYGLDEHAMNQTAQQSWGGTKTVTGESHRVEIRGLKPDTEYYFDIESGQAKGISGGGDVYTASHTFKTLAAQAGSGASAAPTAVAQVKVLDGPSARSITDTSAVIAWTTDKRSSAMVHYGLDENNMTQTAQQPWGGTKTVTGESHRVEIRGLKPATEYHYQIESGQGKGLSGGGDIRTSSHTFKTLSGSAQDQSQNNNQVAGNSGISGQVQDQVRVQAGPIPQAVTDKSVTIWWMTTGDTRTVVKYGTDKNNLNQTAEGQPGREHRVELANLQAGTTYFYDIMSHANLMRSQGQFQTMGTNYQAESKKIRITKGPVIEYLNQDQAIIAWSTTVRSSSLVRYGTDATNLGQTAQAPWGQDTHRVTVKNLKPNTTYYFVVESSQAEQTGAMAKSEPAPFITVDKGQQAMTNPEPR